MTTVLAALLGLGLAAADAEPWRGVDLSYVNEMEDCGAVYRRDGQARDPFALFAEAGANIVRLRLWHDPDWTRYGTLEDVIRSARRARQAGLRLYLDFHYSDDWAHPGKQLRPAAWPPADQWPALAAHLERYTREVLTTLDRQGLLPDVISVGNEINTNLLVDEETEEDAPIDWTRNAVLLNAAIAGVRALGHDDRPSPRVMLHVAQPENVGRWFDAALAAGVTDFDLIGLSYYPKWSSTPFEAVGDAVAGFRERFRREVVVVETAYPWTLESQDSAANLLGPDSLIEGYPATPEGQRRFLLDLQARVLDAGGRGIVYWEPAWVSTHCSTRWGTGSHWDNATLFDHQAELLPGADFLRRDEAR